MTEDFDKVLAEFEDEAARHGGATLEDWAARYPEHRESLVEYAMYSHIFDRGAMHVRETPEERERYLHKATEVRERMMAEGPYAVRPPLTSIIKSAADRGIDVPALSDMLQVGLSLVVKLERRLVDPETIPDALFAKIAAALSRGRDEVAAYLNNSATLSAAAGYKAGQAPRVESQQPFLTAVESCADMREEQKAMWRAEAAERTGGEG